MNYIKRQMETVVLKASEEYPVVMLCGQRQAGKSTLLRHLAGKDKKYVTFDDSRTRNLARTDPEQFFEFYGHNLFIDEFQRVPQILLEIKKIVDEKKYNGESVNGLFWLSGSQKFEMMKSASESLAGRVAVLNLLPISAREMDNKTDEFFTPDIEILKTREYRKPTALAVFERIFCGGLPEIAANPGKDRELYFSSYVNTYIERDISALEQVGKLEEFRTFLTYMAANTAQELNYASISNVVGVSAPTIKLWVSILQRSGIIYLVQPYFSNISKRLIKAPKCYFLDTGLAAYLTSWPTAETLMNGNAAGAFFETYVVSEILKSYCNQGKRPPLYYYRDTDKKEIDLLIVEGDRVYPIEIKKAKTPSNPDKNFGVLNNFSLNAMPGLIICMADELFPLSRNVWLCPVTAI